MAFKTIGWSFVKTTMMMLGELDYGSTITDSIGASNEKTGAALLTAEGPSVVFFYLFCILMSVLLMNLLVGLAVGDIDAIQKNATISSIALQVEFVTDVDVRYPLWLLRKVYRPTLQLYPNHPRGLLQLLMIYSLEDANRSIKDCLAEHRTEDEATDERLERMQEQLETHRERTEDLQRMLHQQNRLLKYMASKLDVQEDFMLTESDYVDAADISLSLDEGLNLTDTPRQNEMQETGGNNESTA